MDSITKMEFISSSIVRNLWGCPYAEWCYVASSGASGGISLMWDRKVVTNVEVCVGEFVEASSFRNVEDNFAWAFAGFYGPNLDNVRRSLWEELVGLSSWLDLPWCSGCDFNVTCFLSERLRSVCLSPVMKDFSDFISM